MIRSLKDNKAIGIDGIANEVWKYGGKKLEDWMRRQCNRIWRGEGWLEE